MGDDCSEVGIELYAGSNAEGPVYEPVHARKIDEDVYELCSSPGLALNMAIGDIISIKNKDAPAVVLKRGGNFCIHIYSKFIPEEDIAELAEEVQNSLGGTLDGRYKCNLSLNVPSKAGMDRINMFFNRFTELTGVQWYYANIYKNLDDLEDETLLYWWLDN
jgi:hypothetical protein